MHDNLHWYRTQRARTLNELRGLPGREQPESTSTARSPALSETARQLANALDLVELRVARLSAGVQKD
jgi:hypothetical protein